MEGRMKRAAGVVISAVIAMTMIYSQAAASSGIYMQGKNSVTSAKISKAKIIIAKKHKKQARAELRSGLILIMTENQPKEKLQVVSRAAGRSLDLSRGLFFDPETAESLYKQVSYGSILRSRK
jgi:hypothetical protein